MQDTRPADENISSSVSEVVHFCMDTSNSKHFLKKSVVLEDVFEILEKDRKHTA